MDSEGSDDPSAWLRTANLAELGVLTASLLHELRQPLFAIKAHAQLGRVEQKGSEGALRFERILDQILHIEELIGYYGKLGEQSISDAPFDLNDPVRDAIEMLSLRARREGISFVAALQDGPLEIRGRALAARQVAVNLLQNACDAVESAEPRRVVIHTRSEGGRAILSVEDTGPGIPTGLADRVFEPFVTTKPPGRGTGLGLYIARRLMGEAGGHLTAIAPEGGGARFEAVWPFSA